MTARLMELPQHLVDSWADELTIEEVLSSISDREPSKYIAKWKHNCGFVWSTAISSRLSGTGCPKCSGSLRGNFRNHKDFHLISKYCLKKSRRIDKITVPCSKCGIEKPVTIGHWLKGSRCHLKCANKRSKKNCLLPPGMICVDERGFDNVNTATKIKVRCSAGHEFPANKFYLNECAISGRPGCSECSRNKPLNVRISSHAEEILNSGIHGNALAAYNILLGMKASSRELRRYRTILGMTQAGMPANKAIELITGMSSTDDDDGPDELPGSPSRGPEPLLPQPPPDLPTPPTPLIRKPKPPGGEPFTIAGTKALIGTINAIASKHPIDDEKVCQFIIDSMVGSFWEKYCEAETGDRKGVSEVVQLLQAERASPNKLMVEIAERFMREHDGALKVCSGLPRWFAPKDAAGHKIELRMMQRLVAYQLTAGGRQRFANWSAPGAGKTLAALLAGLLLEAPLTVVICPNLVIPSWQDQIARTFAKGRAVVEVKQFTPSARCTHLVVNYDLMQGDKEKVQRQIDAFCEKHGDRVGLLVIDEVHRAKNDGEINQGDEKSARRDAIDYLIGKLPAAKVLVQTGTPVLTGCAEGASILELVEPGAVQNYGLQRRDSFDECSRLRIGILRNGVRFKPRIGVELLAPAIERKQGGIYCQSKDVGLDIVLPEGREDLAPLIHIDDRRAIQKLYELRDKRWSWLDMDMILTPFKLKAIVAALRRGTVVYTEHVGSERDQPIVDMLAKAAQRAGFSTAICDGRPSSVRGHSPERAAEGRCDCPRCKGLAGFRRGKIDVLVASRTIGEGVDGLQHAGNRVVINAPPWHDAAWDQLIGRWYRAGQTKNVEVVVPITWMHPQDKKQEGRISLDVLRLGRIYDRGTISDAVLDGCLPTHVGGAAEIVRQAKIELEKLAKRK